MLAKSHTVATFILCQQACLTTSTNIHIYTEPYKAITNCCVASEALGFGHGCAVHIGVDVGTEDVEVDVIYITFLMSAQYTGYLVSYKDMVQPGKCCCCLLFSHIN